MPIIGISGKNRDIQTIKKQFKNTNIEIIQISENSIDNIKNIRFDEIILLQDIKIKNKTYEYMNEIIANSKYLIINGDIEITLLKQININKPVKLITFGFNSKATITVSSIKEDKMIVCVQRNIEKIDKKIIETQEKEITMENNNNKLVYNNLIIFIIKEMHNI